MCGIEYLDDVYNVYVIILYCIIPVWRSRVCCKSWRL